MHEINLQLLQIPAVLALFMALVGLVPFAVMLTEFGKSKIAMLLAFPVGTVGAIGVSAFFAHFFNGTILY